MKEIKLHLGCGKRYLFGYIHIDLDNHPHIDYCHDIKSLPMFKDNSVDLIYSCGTFTYFDREEAIDVLREWNRVLKSGGVLRISVPDFEVIVKLYLQYDNNLEGLGILGPLFGKWKIQSISGQKTLYQKTVYDFKSIKKKLEFAGFTDIKRYDWQEVMPANYDDYSMAYIPHMDKENGIPLSLNVEGIKI